MKKVVSLVLAFVMLLSITNVAVYAYSDGKYQYSVKEAIAEHELIYDEKIDTNRYYFLMPNGSNGEKGQDPDNLGYNEYVASWYNEYTDQPGIFWWDSGVADPTEWPGYTVEKGDSECVFYADVPKAVTVFNWNNNIAFTYDENDPMKYLSKQSINIASEYYDPGESENYPDGTDSFDNMIFVLRPERVGIGDFTEKFAGEWYYYYGDGCYGFVENGDSSDCLRDDHNHKQKSVTEAIAEYEAQTGEKVETNRYYFLMPNGSNGHKGEILDFNNDGSYTTYKDFEESWYNEYTDHAGIYWWDTGVADPVKFPGYLMEKADADCVFYADVPKEVENLIFNNAINRGLDPSAPIHTKAYNTGTIISSFYYPLESPNYPDGVESFDNMIFVIEPGLSIIETAPPAKPSRLGEWYYYYGDGCYGFVENGDSSDCLRDDHNHKQKSITEAISEYEAQTGEKVETDRYYFLMPNGENGKIGKNENGFFYNKFMDSWYNSYTTTAGVYWWESDTFIPDKWPGYSINESDSDDVYYADIPEDVEVIIFNNYINGGLDISSDIFEKSQQTFNILLYDYDTHETNPRPYKDMIYVMDPDVDDFNEFPTKLKFGGNWYYYYGDGCFGNVADGDCTNCIREDHNHEYENELMAEIAQAFEEYSIELDIPESEIFDHYLHYNEDGVIDYVYVQWHSSGSSFAFTGDRFLDYCIQKCDTPSSIGLHIYDVSAKEIYTFKEAQQSAREYLSDFLDNHADELSRDYTVYKCGDVDKDGEVTVLDATFIQRVAAGLDKFPFDDGIGDMINSTIENPIIYYISDIDKDGQRTVLDATAIQRKIANLE